jgi:3-hydroxybutyrate dehydrogenase
MWRCATYGGRRPRPRLAAVTDVVVSRAPAAVDVDLTGRTALVTGAASGIGRACARRLAAAGASVVVVDVDGEAAGQVADEIAGRAEVVDLADLEALDGIDGTGGIGVQADVIVNNAGRQHVAPIEDFPPEVFSQLMRLMVEAPFRLVRASLPYMYERGWGRVINISSVHGLRASPYKAAYVTAKHALEGLSKVIALEGASHGVTSNCVNPGYVRTPLVERQIAAQAVTHGIAEDEVVDRVLLARSAIKRLIEPDEVAELVGYLCCEQASFMTGASIVMDGGWTAN